MHSGPAPCNPDTELVEVSKDSRGMIINYDEMDLVELLERALTRTWIVGRNPRNCRDEKCPLGTVVVRLRKQDVKKLIEVLGGRRATHTTADI